MEINYETIKAVRENWESLKRSQIIASSHAKIAISVMDDFFDQLLKDCSTAKVYPEFSPGDVVKLQSGGPTMTVQQTYVQNPCSTFKVENPNDGRLVAVCEYFNGKKIIEQEFFKESLIKVNDNPKPEAIKANIDFGTNRNQMIKAIESIKKAGAVMVQNQLKRQLLPQIVPFFDYAIEQGADPKPLFDLLRSMTLETFSSTFGKIKLDGE